MFTLGFGNIRVCPTGIRLGLFAGHPRAEGYLSHSRKSNATDAARAFEIFQGSCGRFKHLAGCIVSCLFDKLAQLCSR